MEYGIFSKEQEDILSPEKASSPSSDGNASLTPSGKRKFVISGRKAIDPTIAARLSNEAAPRAILFPRDISP
jgi:hypothetical protein